jgi:hypothetical protein
MILLNIADCNTYYCYQNRFLYVPDIVKCWVNRVCYNDNMIKIMILLLLLFPTVALAQPEILFDAETRDFGVVNGDKPLQHTFEVTNGGTEDLIIKKLDAP